MRTNTNNITNTNTNKLIKPLKNRLAINKMSDSESESDSYKEQRQQPPMKSVMKRLIATITYWATKSLCVPSLKERYSADFSCPINPSLEPQILASRPKF